MLYPFSGFGYTAIDSPYRYDLRNLPTHNDLVQRQWWDFQENTLPKLYSQKNHKQQQQRQQQQQNNNEINPPQQTNPILFARITQSAHKKKRQQQQEQNNNTNGDNHNNETTDVEMGAMRELLIPCSLIDEYIPTTLYNTVMHERYNVPFKNNNQNNNDHDNNNNTAEFKNVKRLVFHPNRFTTEHQNGAVNAQYLLEKEVEVFYLSHAYKPVYSSQQPYINPPVFHKVPVASLDALELEHTRFKYSDYAGELRFVGSGVVVL